MTGEGREPSVMGDLLRSIASTLTPALTLPWMSASSEYDKVDPEP